MLRYLGKMRVEGASTNKDVLMNILKNSRFLTGAYTTTFFETLKQLEVAM